MIIIMKKKIMLQINNNSIKRKIKIQLQKINKKITVIIITAITTIITTNKLTIKRVLKLFNKKNTKNLNLIQIIKNWLI